MDVLRREISEVAKYANPPKLVKLVVEALCIMFGINPQKVGDAGAKVDDYWQPGKQMLSQAKNVLDKMMGYDKVRGFGAAVALQCVCPVPYPELYERACSGLGLWSLHARLTLRVLHDMRATAHTPRDLFDI